MYEIIHDRYTISPDNETQYVIVRLPNGMVLDLCVVKRDPDTGELIEHDLDELVASIATEIENNVVIPDGDNNQCSEW